MSRLTPARIALQLQEGSSSAGGGGGGVWNCVRIVRGYTCVVVRGVVGPMVCCSLEAGIIVAGAFAAHQYIYMSSRYVAPGSLPFHITSGLEYALLASVSCAVADNQRG